MSKGLIDIDKPVTNSSLVDAFENFKVSDRLTATNLVEELNKATFLVPYTSEIFDTAVVDDITTILPSSDFTFYLRKTDMGSVLTIATDWKGIRKFLPFLTKDKVNALVMPAEEVWDWVLSNEVNYAGVEILTSKEAYTLPKSYIRMLSQSTKKVEK